jgi:hypothetical protein
MVTRKHHRESRFMPDFVYDLPLPTLAFWFSVASVGAMIAGVLVIKPIMRVLIGAGNEFNQSISYATSGFSLFYGLLLGLLTVAAFQNSQQVQEGVLGEASALGALYSDMSSYPEPLRSEMRTMLRDYTLFTVHRDWPAHRQGHLLDGGFNRTDAMRRKLAGFEPQTRGQEILHAEVIGSFRTFIEARQRRLSGVDLRIPPVLWYAVLVGAGVSILLIVLLRMRLIQQFVLGTISAFFLGVILFVIVVLDRPLRGEAGLGPGPLKLVWDRQMVWDEPLR